MNTRRRFSALVPLWAAIALCVFMCLAAGAAYGEGHEYTQPQDVAAAAGEDAVFCVTAPDAAAFQWQCWRCDLEWMDTFLPGYDTPSLTVRANLSRTTLKWRCRITFGDGTEVYTEAAKLLLTTLSPDEITVNADSRVLYDVPLYNQRGTGLCWSFSMQMAEDYMTGAGRTADEAYQRCVERAKKKNGEDRWNMGNVTFDVNSDNDAPSNAVTEAYVRDMYSRIKYPVTPERLYQMLVMYGPCYMSYGEFEERTILGRVSGHFVVLTGIDLATGTVYSNNPWEVRGEQSWDEAMHVFAVSEEDDPLDRDAWMLETVKGSDWPVRQWIWEPQDIDFPEMDEEELMWMDTLEDLMIRMPEEMMDVMFDEQPEKLTWKELVAWAENWIEEHWTEYRDGDEEDEPVILDGQDSIWVIGSREPLYIRGSGALDDYLFIRIDNMPLLMDYITVTPGSTAVQVAPEYLMTLGEGRHSIEMFWLNGPASTSFTVARATEPPRTGDGTPLALLAALLILSAGILAAAGKAYRTR